MFRDWLGDRPCFLAEGAKVVVADIQEKKGAALESEFAGKIAFRHCDVVREDDLAETMQAAKHAFGGLDVLVNNAGANRVFNGVMDMPADGWDATHALILRGPMLGIKHAAPLMIERGAARS